MNLTAPAWANTRITARHWHYAGVGLLCILNLVLAVRLVVAWRAAGAGNAMRIEQHETEYRAMQLKTRPLRGLDRKIAQAQADEQAFYLKRFPDTYSEVETELGKLAVKNNVLLNRVQYGQAKPNEGVTRLSMEASLTGDYAPVVRFINGLERSRIFFIIDGIALNGQQGGMVSLRMRLTTYLRTDAGNGAAPIDTSAQRVRPTAGPVHATQAKHSVTERR